MLLELKELKRNLIASAKEALDQGNMTARVTRLIGQLKQAEIDSMEKLRNKWEVNPYYLMNSLELWYD